MPASDARIGRRRQESGIVRNVNSFVHSSFGVPGRASTHLFLLMFPDSEVVTTDETLRKPPFMVKCGDGVQWRGAHSEFFGVRPTSPTFVRCRTFWKAHVPQRFFSSPRAAQGILRRAGSVDAELPPRLQAALESLATRPDEGGKMTSTSRSITSDKGAARPAPSPKPGAEAEGQPTTSAGMCRLGTSADPMTMTDKPTESLLSVRRLYADRMRSAPRISEGMDVAQYFERLAPERPRLTQIPSTGQRGQPKTSLSGSDGGLSLTSKPEQSESESLDAQVSGG